ncbi:NIMA related kinase 4, putative [Plasmodium knowlesi strain H]|uniref:non-specific serine/threonine protein kinase n=3 Tax=Plasmodium knowlesi TaxID=5850 RepID=A0A1A7W4J0_PLAKH|nr:NIMA related kinase 4, putative [Plasmodium knowlesi strain H]OTN68484.1 putative NIMA related kinase 4 [Plasmodium knowlesi]CAA9986571.1 NIMA related kinase 4, putative [Plasmodium knowlesi strain H]SBO24158.1 NIMA related kinase 4, putative [Plasmodium knowlesi strain H]SBO29284.1 NIMA related kinase 4, putative [Plasmodium knowlesi strain H]VVS76045.1 NIMA related kinase 4, putative [Plasmodium knowlesi strain H]
MNKYEKIRDIGKGNYGNTILVRDRKNDHYVMKIINISQMTPKEKRQCLKEVELLSKLNHPFIVKYIESYIEGDTLRIVMKHCKGGDLYHYIQNKKKQNTPIKETRILIWLTQILTALKFLHSNHILHRDMKSLNILIDNDKRVRLCDFGISKVLENTLDYANTLIGTPYYLSPELCKDKKYSWPSDVWATGCLIYELATFRTPFHSTKGIQQLCYNIRYAPIPDLPNIYSKELNNIYKSMLIREPNYRATVQQLLVSDIVQRQLKLLIEEKIREKQNMKKPLKEKSAAENDGSGANEQEVKTLLLDVVDA